MNNELLEALNVLEEEKNISKDTLLEAIENSLVTACKNHFGKSDEIKDAFLSVYSDKLKHTRFNKFIIVAVLVLIILGSSLYFGIRHFNTSYERRNGYYVESIKDISSPAPTASPDTEPTPLEIIN